MILRTKSAWPSPDVVREEFTRPRFVRLRLDRFPVGADNRRIDVALGQVLSSAAANYVSALVREKVQQLWKQPVPAFSEAIVENFLKVTMEHQRAVVKGARVINRLERVQLYQLAVVKLLLDLVDSELYTLRAGLDDARAEPSRQLSGQSLRLHHQAVLLGHNLGPVRFRVASELMRQYMRVERGALRNLRKAVLGLSWPVPESMLNNPFLQLNGVGGANDFYRVYPFLLHDSDNGCRVGHHIFETFAQWLPDNVVTDLAKTRERSSPGSRGVLGEGAAQGFLEMDRRVQGLLGQRELQDCFATWLDQPANAVALLGGTHGSWPQQGPWRHSVITGLQRELNKKLHSALTQSGLMSSVCASYELQAVYPLSGLVDSETVLFDFLRGSIGRREMLRRLQGVESNVDPAAALRRIEELRRGYRAGPAAGKHQVVARFAGDFLRFRRDLKLAWRAFIDMDRLRLVADESTLDGPRDTGRLQVFCRREAAVETAGNVVGHAIVKAEIRGFAALAVQMRQRNLDPAAHFSRYFYDPVTRLLEQFGAQKVVVEADAVILSLLEHAGEGAEGLAVARGCCIATKLIQLVETMNLEHDRIGLQGVELGLGIAYTEEAPTYLYDHARKVTISPAIQRARSLSSCYRLLRETCPPRGGRGVCVASRVATEEEGEQGGEELVRYNVNGIELDAAAFARLNVEIALGRMRRRGKRPATFFVGRCPDVKGESHWLLVRERTVKLWIGGRLLEAEEEGRRYYEVVSDSRLIERVCAQLPRDETDEAITIPPRWH